MQLTAFVSPGNATNKGVTWSSSDTSIASVSSSGLVTAKGIGIAYITCKALDGSGKTATCKIGSLPGMLSRLHNAPSASLSVDDEMQIIDIAIPGNASDSSMTNSREVTESAKGQTTGINENKVNRNKVDDNTIKIYNMNGAKLKKPQKGLNIINGRKVYVK